MSIFCDLDGVLADFDAGVKALCCKKYANGLQILEQNENLPLQFMITNPEIFEDLPLMPEATYLWNELLPYKPIILTGCTNSNVAKNAKEKWCRQYLGQNCLRIKTLDEMHANPNYDYYIIITTTKKKPLFASDGAILIDDRKIIDKEWEAAGGIFFHYDGSNAKKIINTIKEWTH